MKKHFFLSIIILLCMGTSCSSAPKEKEVEQATINTSLKFNSDGEFKIAQFTDIHWDENADNCKQTIATIQHVLDAEKPDFAILTGDIVCYKPAEAGWKSIAKVFSEAKIPWGVLMGNHDAEQDMTRQEMYALLKTQAHYIGDIGPADIYGTGNFVLPIEASKDNKPAAVLYCLDSNDYTQNQLAHGYYDWIRFNQIAWYRSHSEKFTQANDGKPLPSLAYFHIPLVEYNEQIASEKYYGEKREGGASSPNINSGFFSAILEMGDVMATLVGHDHDNSFIGIKNDIALAYGRVSGWNAYGQLPRGARIVKLYEGKHQFDTWIRTEEGEKELYYYPTGITQEEEQTSTYLSGSKLVVASPGVKYKYYEYEGKIKTVHALADSKISALKGEGKLKNFTLEPMKREDFFGIEFDAWIDIPKAGIYKFYAYTDDGSKLYIDDQLIVDNDGSHSARRADGRIALQTGFHKIKLLYFESYMGESIEIGISSRDITEMPIPDSMLFVAE